ncbi:MAG: type II toxin-antitoxin system RelE/ParE family toxin [Lamprocystis purpurea]|jgi:plasmid stabilization system protein ParE|uniref:type II toxin-antitoxin system RelE/ParE family toxin n=1 Tax=Lamprocystis purpurea TaxID=61598 RepID=UPI0003673D80|nr:type II toxin-antitoxin system RelE/ParE family toxin [Lamprocystis purpurea]MBV5272740.1 type II toxin-antitoxin system RelE/ParE family toxin [Lamprocystis purpurea]
MAAELVIAPEVAQDIAEAYGWYEGRRCGLGEEFLSCVDARIQAICRMPEINARVHKEYRRALVRRFPYAVFYEYVADTVTVFCIFHTARSPEKWRRRLP